MQLIFVGVECHKIAPSLRRVDILCGGHF